jgi:ubiquinone/menaquinone biosynthesis C-methylase UbiE
MDDSRALVARWSSFFDTVAERYDQSGVPFFGPIAQGLVDALAPQPGERALDAGCGRGAATFRLADRVGGGGTVDGIDISAEMVSRTEAKARETGLTNVRVSRGDAGEPPSTDYDLVASSLVLFFLPDPVATLTAWRSALAPGGRVGATTFRPWPSRWHDVAAVFEAHRATDTDAGPSAFRHDAPWDDDASVEDLFRTAGFADVTTSALVHAVPIKDAAQFEQFSFGTVVRSLWVSVPPERQQAVLADLDDLFDTWRDPDGLVRLDVAVRYTLGRT